MLPYRKVIDMTQSSITKRALADSMKELMNEKSLSKISIKDIVQRCNMNRKSFYYHFKDKYDLVNWIYYTDFVTSFEENELNSQWSILESICEFFYNNRGFYCNALEVKGQNSFYDYFGEVLSPIIAIEFENIFQDKDKEFYITFFTDAIRTSITRWLLEGSKIPPNEFVRLMENAATGVAVKMYKEKFHQEETPLNKILEK